MIVNAFKSVRITHSPCLITSKPEFGHKASAIRFRQVTVSAQPDKTSNDMEKDKNDKREKEENPNDKTGDVMSHSFGEGYSSRSNDDGFGGIYGGNNTDTKSPEDRSYIHENHPEYDKTQGSEVKEKEKARFQTNANA